MAEESLKHKTKKGIYWTFFNQFANTGLSFFVGILMARVLTPEDYGITALPSVFLAIANVFIGSGFSTALIRKETEVTDADLSTSFYYSIGVGTFCYLLIFISAPWIADFFAVPVLKPLVRVSALSFIISPITTPQSVITRRKLDFKLPTKISIITNIVGAIVGIALTYTGFGLWALVFMGLVQSITQTALYFYYVRWTPKLIWSRESFRYLWGFGNKMMASSLIETAYTNLTPLIVGKFYSPSDLGIYNRARGYANLPSQTGTGIIQSVTFPVLSRMQGDDEFLANGYRKMLRVSAFVIFPIMMLLAALAHPLIIVMITAKWEACVIFLQLLCFSSMWYPIHAINLNLLQVKGRSDLFLKLEIWKKLLGLTVMVCTLPFGLIYFVAAGIASSFISLFINTYYTGKLINVGFIKQMKDLLPTYGLSLLVFCVVMIMNMFIDNLWLELILGGIVGAGLYFGLAIILKFSELQDVKYMLNRK